MAAKGSGLTAKQQAFARCVGVRNMSLTDAYRECYNTEHMKSKSVSDKASELRKHVGIAAEIRRYNQEVDRQMIASVVSDEDLVLTELRRVIKDGESDNVKVRAAEALGKTIPGLFKGEERTEPQRTVAEIQTELDEILVRFGLKLVKSDKPDKAVH